MKNIYLLEPWEIPFVANLKNSSKVIWTDEEAVDFCPQLRHLYDKLWVSKNLTNKPAMDLGACTPKKYPVFVRPRVNLMGMGVKAYKADKSSDITNTKGMIAQEVLEGDQISTDYIIKNNKVIDSFSFLAKKDEHGVFKRFESVQWNDSDIVDIIESLKLGTRAINVETIGNTIVEIHLRPSVQFFDICGGMLKQLPKLMLKGEYKPVKWEKTYSVVYRRKRDAVPKLSERLSKPPHGVRSTQLCWYSNLPLSASPQDEFTFRYMIINGTDLTSIDNYAKIVKRKIIFT